MFALKMCSERSNVQLKKPAMVLEQKLILEKIWSHDLLRPLPY